MITLNQTGLRIGTRFCTMLQPDDSFAVIVKGSFKLVPDDVMTPMPSAQQERLVLDRRYPDGRHEVHYPSDKTGFKPRADIVVTGGCHAPGGVPTDRLEVAFTIGNRRKALSVIGDRYWKKEPNGDWSMSAPEPFTRMPLRWNRAFGSVDYLKNSVGRGRYNTWDRFPDGRVPLPNIEHPDHPIETISDEPPVAGFAPLGPETVNRLLKRGTRDDTWRARRAPVPPEDYDWTAGNAAPEDQQLDGYLRGDERISFERLHPTLEHFEADLPRIRIRVFLNRLRPEGLQFEEVDMRLDTLWAEPESEQAKLVWRGLTDAPDRDFKTVSCLLGVTEPMNEEPRPVAFYRELMEKLLAGRLAQWRPPVSEELVAARVGRYLDKAKQTLDDTELPADLIASLKAETDPQHFFKRLTDFIRERYGTIQTEAGEARS